MMMGDSIIGARSCRVIADNRGISSGCISHNALLNLGIDWDRWGSPLRESSLCF